jgi:hypothetical protein
MLMFGVEERKVISAAARILAFVPSRNRFLKK